MKFIDKIQNSFLNLTKLIYWSYIENLGSLCIFSLHSLGFLFSEILAVGTVNPKVLYLFVYYLWMQDYWYCDCEKHTVLMTDSLSTLKLQKNRGAVLGKEFNTTDYMTKGKGETQPPPTPSSSQTASSGM